MGRLELLTSETKAKRPVAQESSQTVQVERERAEDGTQPNGGRTEKKQSAGGWKTTSELVDVDAQRTGGQGREKSVGVAPPRSGGRCQRSGTLTTGSEIRKREYNKNPKVADYKDGYEVLELMLGD